MRGAASRWPWWIITVGAFATGVFLRTWQLASQMLIDDEWHAVRMVIRANAHEIATNFGLADYCIPLTLYYRWLYDHHALDEWQMHLPLLVAGIVLLLVAPWLLRKVLDFPERAVWTGLLALSPTLVYFSRTARPYALVALLGFVAIVAFRNWQRRQGDPRAWLTVYVIATFMAGWLHILSLVFTLWPFVHYGVAALIDCGRSERRQRAVHSIGYLCALGVFVACLLAVVLAPPLINNWGAMSGKAGVDSVTLDSLYRTVLMQFGIASAWVWVVLSVLFVFGVVRLWRRDQDFIVLTLGAAVAGVITICVARPTWIQHAPVLVRYAAPILPFLLLYIAEGCVGVVEHVRVPAVGETLAALGLVGLYFAGPMPRWMYYPNQFMDHEVFQFDYDPRQNPYSTLLQLGPVSPFYLELARRPPGSVTVVVTPERAQSNFIPEPWYQKIHRQNVKFALASPVCGTGAWDEFAYTERGARFQRMLKLGDILDGDTDHVDYLVMRLHPWTVPPGRAFDWPVAWPDMQACVAKVEARLGPPVYSDDQLVAFAMDRNGSLHRTR